MEMNLIKRKVRRFRSITTNSGSECQYFSRFTSPRKPANSNQNPFTLDKK